jgi:hypothetical protein
MFEAKRAANGDWNPKTEVLDELAKDDPKLSGFVHDVKAFYENLHNKRWAETYKQRSKPFRDDFPEQLYIETAQRKSWELIDYEVLPRFKCTIQTGYF